MSVEGELYQDLEVDRVLSLGQVERHYGQTITPQKGLFFFDSFLAPTHGSNAYARVPFVTLERKVTRMNAASLRHFAGVAEMRRLLKAPRDTWKSEAGARFAAEQPDALWFTQGGEVAIEYDAGSYSAKQITVKAFTFRRYERQVWGSPSRKRVRHLGAFLLEVGEDTAPLYAPWD